MNIRKKRYPWSSKEYADSMKFINFKLRHRYFGSHVEQNAQINIFESDTAQILDSCFNGRLMLRRITDLNFKMITSLLAVRYLCAWILKNVLNPPAEEHSGQSQVHQTKLFERIVDVFKSTLLFFQKVPGIFGRPDIISDLF